MNNSNNPDDTTVAKSNKGPYRGWGLFVWSVILAVFGFLYGKSGGDVGLFQFEGSFGYALLFAWVFAGFPWGWRYSSIIPSPKFPKLYSRLEKTIPSIVIELSLCVLKVWISCLVGLIALPCGIFARVSTHIKEKDMEKSVNN